jgi:hypothetical protein
MTKAIGTQSSCARCGGLGHFAKRCQMPPQSRPNIRRLLRSDCRTIGRDKVERLVEYVERLEAERRHYIPLLRTYMEGTRED